MIDYSTMAMKLTFQQMELILLIEKRIFHHLENILHLMVINTNHTTIVFVTLCSYLFK
jgi:hypothetical protein